MKMFIYGNFLKEHNFYTNIHVNKEEPTNYSNGTIREIKTCKDKMVLSNLVHKELHLLGELDDETGIIVPCVKVCVVYDDYLNVIEEAPKEEGVKNV